MNYRTRIALLLLQFSLMLAADNSGKVLLIVGTRPDCIKMAPVYHALKDQNIPVTVCSTDQHADLLDDIFNLFGMEPEIRLHSMKVGQDLFYITTTLLEKLKAIYRETRPSLVLVQGDTTTAMTAALAAFYLKIPVGHVEAGLRTHNVYSPYPEEFNRRLITLLSAYHFAPTEKAVQQLVSEGIDKKTIHLTGNTVVDALYFIQKKLEMGTVIPSHEIKSIVEMAQVQNKKIIIFTAHRRESLEYGLKTIFSTLKEILSSHEDICCIYPMHPNPKIKEIAAECNFESSNNLFITKPLSYVDMVYLLTQGDIVVTDSGGLQEEANSLGKPVIVLRNETEREEGVKRGLSILAGYDRSSIREAFATLIATKKSRNQVAIYGDGNAGTCIADILRHAHCYSSQTTK